MAYQFDEMGNVIGEYETEEERKAREALANQVATKHELTTYADGSQTRTTKEELPATPTMTQVGAPVNPALAARMVPAPAPVTAPIAPSAYNAAIAQQESGANPNIGYHNPQAGTAYGTYGLTAPGYQDARKLNPALPQDITQATPEQQTQAMDAYTQQNAKYLQSYGVEPTQQNLAAAHFLGAKGLSDYLQTGAISPAAAQANGGEDKVRQIVNARLGGQAAPASGALVNAPAAVTAPDQNTLFTEAGKDPFKWLQISQDKSQPPAVIAAAKEHARDLLTQEFNMNKAKEQATQTIAAASSGDPKASRAIADELKNQEGSWVKMILLGFLSPQLAGEEAVKLGFGNKWESVTNDKGETGLVQVNAKGLPLKGINSDNTTMTPEQLTAFGAGGVTAKKAHEMPAVHGTPVQRVNPQTQQLETGLMMYDPKSRQSYIQVGGQRKDTTGWTTMAQAPGSVFNAAAAKTQGTAAGEGYTPTTVPQMPGVPGTGTAGIAQPAPQMPGAVAPAIPGTPAVTGAMPVPQQAQGAVAPVAPGAMVPGRPAGTIAQQKLGTEFQKDQQQAFSKYVAEDVQPKADAGSQISRIRKDQINGPDGILNNPELAGLMQGGKGEVGNIIRDLITGNFKDQADLSTRVAALDLTPRQKDVLYKQIGLNAQINPLTLKANAGPGAVSEAEHKINAQANVDITRQPLYSGLTLMTRDQFEKDLQVARNDFRSARPDIATTDQMNRAWDAEKRKAQQSYDGIYAARAAYIAKYNPNGNNPGAVVDAFKYYPVPEWTGQSWDYKTDFARKAARPGLSSFNR